MSDLIPECQLADFIKIVQEGRIGELKSCEITFNDIPIFTAIIPHGDFYSVDYARTQAAFLAQRSNIVGGKDPVELLELVKQEDAYPHLTKARAAMKAKREAARV